MKKRLRLLAWLITLTMLCQMLPFSAFAQSDVGQELALAVAQSLEEENGEAIAGGKCGENLTWSLSNDWTLTIRGTGKMYNYNSQKLNYQPPWYRYSNYIRAVILKPGITYIGSDAFANSSIISVEIPDTVTSIGDPDSIRSGVFSGCIYLKSVSIPDSVTSIGSDAFSYCTSLTSITIPDSVTTIGHAAFYKCTSLTSATLLGAVTSIDGSTFNFCSSLASVTLPDSITSIKGYAFSSCTSLQDVYYQGSQEQWESILVDEGNDALKNATIHYNSGKEDPDPTPNPNPNPDPSPDPNPDPDPDPNPSGKVFEFGKDNLNFLNRTEYYFSSSLTSDIDSVTNFIMDFFGKEGTTFKKYYHISDEYLQQLTQGMSAQVKNFIKRQQKSYWSGSCFGMSSVVWLNYLAPERLDLSASIHDLKSPRNDVETENLINYYHLMQYLPTAFDYQSDTRQNFQNNISNEINIIIQELKNKKTVLAGIVSEHGAHAILLLDILSESDDFYEIRIYDPGYCSEKTLKLFKKGVFTQTGQIFPHIEYGDYKIISMYYTSKNIDYLDLRNYYKKAADNEKSTDYDEDHVSIDCTAGSFEIIRGQKFVKAENGKIIGQSDNILAMPSIDDTLDDNTTSTWDVVFPKSSDSLEVIFSDVGINNADLLLNDTLLSISASGPVKLTYDEQNRTVDVTAENPADVNLMFTQNEPTSSWPWHSWAIDTTGTTTLHAELDDEGLHLNGDGIANAKYATENMDTDTVDSGSIPADADSVIIISKKDGSGNTTDIETPDPVEPADLTVSVSGGTIIQINDDAFAESLTSHTAKQGDKITIMADTTDKFNGWTVNKGDVTLDDATAPATTFTMGEKSVRITAEYQNNSTDPTPTPTPGGGSSSGGGGGGGGAAVLIGVGAAAAITAGVIMMSPVDIKGRVVLADQAAVSGAKISLLREGKVVAQTTADENGSFSLKAKRGSYELTAAYTNADGQLIYKTIDIKAPAKDLTVTF